jgi:hypothetical protein
MSREILQSRWNNIQSKLSLHFKGAVTGLIKPVIPKEEIKDDDSERPVRKMKFMTERKGNRS